LSVAIDLCEKGLVPDPLMRFGMRRLLAKRLRSERLDDGETQFERFRLGLESLREAPVALETDKANEQHYELPADFFRSVLGAHLKYSCGYWPDATTTLDESETEMLRLTGERAQLEDGQDILELGCGWGSLTLWMAEQYPGSRVTAVSNSASQREYIMGQAGRRGLANVNVITADANHFSTDQCFDRVVSVEMFEHMRNYELLLKRISGWLKNDGRLFVHIFCHRDLMYPFAVRGRYDWMAEHFFTGGLMPSEQTLLYFQNNLTLEDQWRVSGTHYERTCNAWLARMDAGRGDIRRTLAGVYGEAAADCWINRWRMFFMACAELFGYRDGSEWMVAHYRFRPTDGAAG